MGQGRVIQSPFPKPSIVNKPSNLGAILKPRFTDLPEIGNPPVNSPGSYKSPTHQPAVNKIVGSKNII